MRIAWYTSFLLVCLMWISPTAFGMEFFPFASESEAASSLVVIPEDLPSNEIGEFVAPLGEEQVRNLLISNLRTAAIANEQTVEAPPISIVELLKGIGNANSPLGGGLHDLVASASTYISSVDNIINRIADGQGYTGFVKIIGLLVMLIAGAWLIESICMRRWYKKEFQVSGLYRSDAWKSRFKYPFYYLLVRLIGLILFSIAGYVLANFALAETTNSYTALTRFFDLTIIFRFLTIVYKFLMYSQPKGLDLIDDRINKLMLERSFIVFLVIFFVAYHGFVMTMRNFGLSNEHFVLSTAVTFGLLVNPLIILTVWSSRNDIDRVLFGSVGRAESADEPYSFAARAKIWPAVVTIALLVVFSLWQIMIITDNTSKLKPLEQAWWIIIVFPFVDLIVSSLLNRLTGLPVFQNGSFQKRKSRFVFVIRNIVRLGLLTTLLLNILGVLHIPILSQLASGEREFVDIMVDIGLILLVGFVVWESVLLWIEHKLPDEEEGTLDMDGEGGGATATRTETLLPLLSTTVLVVLFITVVISVLNTLGVQIAPLLAGAGVVGLAIGFGSQKLVQDILSGVFFLVDDAFRKGEYVELADMGGTVEKLSVRSMQLRHHQGAVQTIPYGEIQTVKNHSRDWVTMKLELRLAYDVDLEKVRKIIKKIGIELAEGEEFGPFILAPLKSQGVMRVDESALIVRMKFTAIPGEQWTIRRVAYTRVRDALAAEGIEFARREVKVRLPEELENLQIKDFERKLHEKNTVKPDGTENAEPKEEFISPATIAAAAISAVVAQELEEKPKKDSGDDR